mmetsp:Transcript_5788/g.24167  ORF Transcript_5788/g.24167 Transcript_5788/m.24167 type:complete len:273 (-) Transcript_5788:3062-3880(-)
MYTKTAPEQNLPIDDDHLTGPSSSSGRRLSTRRRRRGDVVLEEVPRLERDVDAKVGDEWQVFLAHDVLAADGDPRDDVDVEERLFVGQVGVDVARVDEGVVGVVLDVRRGRAVLVVGLFRAGEVVLGVGHGPREGMVVGERLDRGERGERDGVAPVVRRGVAVRAVDDGPRARGARVGDEGRRPDALVLDDAVRERLVGARRVVRGGDDRFRHGDGVLARPGDVEVGFVGDDVRVQRPREVASEDRRVLRLVRGIRRRVEVATLDVPREHRR